MALIRTAAALLAAVLTATLASVLSPDGAVGAMLSTRPQYESFGVPLMTLAATPPQVATGRSTLLRGRLTDPATGAGRAGEPVRVEALAADGSWIEVTELVSDADGWASSVQTPQSTTGYRLHVGDPGASNETVSPVVQVPVRTLTAYFDRPAVRVGRDVALRGVLAAEAGSTLRLERRRGGQWQRVDRTRTAGDGSYAFTVTPDQPGFSRWRVVRDAGPTGADEPRTVARLPRLDAYRLHTYTVTTRGDVRSGLREFRAVVAATYADPRGWLRAHHRFREVRRDRQDSDFTVVLAQARMLPTFSSACSSTYSCRVGRYVVINKKRWRHGSPHFPGDLPTYRRMLVDHETGHWLGLGHRYCSRPGARAPVMQQQSKGMQGCRVNPWPLPREIRAVS